MWSYFIEIFYAGAHFHLGEIYQIMGRLDEAKIEFEKCLKDNPEHRADRENLSFLQQSGH